MLINNILTPAQQAELDPSTVAEIESQLQLRALSEADEQRNFNAPEAPPHGLSAVERMKWARAHGQVVPEFTLPEQSASVTVPPDVAGLRPVDRMRWARQHARTGE